MSRTQKSFSKLRGLENLFGVTEDATLKPGTPTEVRLSRIKATFTFTPNGKPLRHLYDRVGIKAWVEADLRENGIHTPILLRPHPNDPDNYELVDGMTRFIAADEFLDYDTIQAVIRELTDAQAYRAATASNTNRRKFTALEYLDHAIALLATELQIAPKEVVSLLYRFNNLTKQNGNHSAMVNDPQFQIVTSVFDFLGQTTWKSFVTNYLPLLNLPDEIAQAIKSGEIDYTKGIAISRIKEAESRGQLLQTAIVEGLSLDEVQDQVREIQKPESEPSTPTVKSQFTKAVKRLNKSTVWRDPKKIRMIERLITELEALIADDR